MSVDRNTLCPCGSGKKYKKCCAIQPGETKALSYINEAHEWMDKNILKGRDPILYGFLILVDHAIPADEIWNQLRFWSEQYLESTVNRTKKFHNLIDVKMAIEAKEDEKEGFPPSFCHKGCSNCCYQLPACTDEEAQLIFSYCNEHTIPIDFQKLERQLRFIEVDSNNNFYGKTTWEEQPVDDQACIFLNDGICSIWDVRPFVCRVHLAENTDAHCRSHNGVPDPDARGIHYPICSYILSAVFTIHHDTIGKLMGRLLLEQKQHSSL